MSHNQFTLPVPNSIRVIRTRDNRPLLASLGPNSKYFKAYLDSLNNSDDMVNETSLATDRDVILSGIKESIKPIYINKFIVRY